MEAIPSPAIFRRIDVLECAAEKPMTTSLVWLLAISGGCIVANIYYVQPLLPDLARSFGLSVTKAGTVALMTQLGTALGMLGIVPQGDIRERRSLIVGLLVVASACLAAAALSPNFIWLCAASFTVGVTAATNHVIVPMVASLAPQRERGRYLGIVMSGVLMGILFSRTLSGFVNTYFGWRAIYWFASFVMLGVALVLRARLPVNLPSAKLSWPELMKSIWGLARKHRQLREAALLGALFFCAFSAFWTTMAFLLAGPPFHYDSSVAGMFGLVGAAGAAGAPLVGHLSDRYGCRRTIFVALTITFLAFALMFAFQTSLLALIVGVLLMDLGVQSGHVANQTRIYGLAADARSRLNTVYMVAYFCGGAAGSLAGAACWQWAGWSGVCGFAMAALLLAFLVFIRGRSHEQTDAVRLKEAISACA